MIIPKFSFFSRKDLVFKVVVYAHDSIYGVTRILGKEGIVGFTLKVETLLNAEGIGRVN